MATLCAELFLADQRITGQIFSLAPSRLSDALNREPDKFLILREACVTSLDGREELIETSSMLVNKGQVHLARPLEENSGPVKDVFAYVEKVERRCTISIPPYRVKGAFQLIHDVDVVNAAAKMRGAFIPLTNAKFTYLPDPKFQWQSGIVVVNRSLIHTISALN